MGLARNSLYRYYSNKDHILIAVVRSDMEPFLERLEALENEIADPGERVSAWVSLQMEIAAGPCHAMIRLLGEIPNNSKELHQQISDLHEPMSRVLRQALEQLLAGSERDLDLLAAMITSMVQSAAGLAMGRKDASACCEELQRSVQRILEA